MSVFDDRPSGAQVLTPEVRRLGIVLGLPLVDGVFVTLVLAGVLEEPIGILLVGTLVFGGSGAIAVILADLAGDPHRHLPGLLLIGIAIVCIAGLQAAIAPTLASVLDAEILTGVAAVVLVMTGISLGSPVLDRYLPRTGFVVLVGLVVSLRPNGFAVDQSVDPWLAASGATAASVGLVLSIGVLLAGSRILAVIDQDRFRYGGGISLGVLGVSLLSSIPEYVPLIVLVFAFLLAIDFAHVRERVRWGEGRHELASVETNPR